MTIESRTGLTIRAVRAAELGPFTAGVALEGLSGRLDVLAAANEAGKSTLLKALNVLLTERHTSTAKKLHDLRSDSGGAPLIEADLDIDGRPWRLRKRYLAQRTAELIDLAGDEHWRGADAEERAQALLSRGDGNALRGVVWVEQTKSFGLPEPKGDLAAAISGLIEREAEDAAGAGLVRRLRTLLSERLGAYVTASARRPKKGGPLATAMAERDDIAGRLEAAVDKVMAAQDRAARLEVLKTRLEKELSAEMVATARERLAAAQTAASEAERARERLKTADERLAAAQLAASAARGELALFQRRLDDVAQLALEIDRLTGAETAAATAMAEAERQRDAHRERHNGIASRLEQGRRRLGEIDGALAWAASLQRAGEAERRLAAAQASVGERERIMARLAAATVDEAGVAALRQMLARLDTLHARIEAAAARVWIDYDDGADGQASADGRALAGGEPLVVDKPTRIVIAGVGTVTVAPAHGGSAAAVERDGLQRQIAETLERMGLTDVTGAEVALSERRMLEQTAAAAAARLTAMAPDGLDALVQAAAQARAAANASLPAIASAAQPEACEALAGERAALAGEIADLEAAVKRCQSDMREADEAFRSASALAARALAEKEAARRQREELTGLLPAAVERDDRGRQLAAAAADAHGQLEAAGRERGSWAVSAPDAVGFAGLLEAAATAASALRALETERDRIKIELAELEGALKQDGADGAGAEAARLQERLAEATARVEDLQLEVDALVMIDDRLDRRGQSDRERFLVPVIERLRPLVSALFPGADVTLEGPMLVTHLQRTGGIEPVARLSDGTREQIALLVRLAYARLMADRGARLPLVLDDALVFSDDARLERAFALLAEAASHHQVLILSCRQHAVGNLAERLGAHRAELTAWHDNADTSPRASANTTKSRLALQT